MTGDRALVVDGCLLFPVSRCAQLPTIRLWSKEPLTSFVDLMEGTPEQIAEFANTWGPLGLCGHGLPYDHGQNTISVYADGPTVMGLGRSCRQRLDPEPGAEFEIAFPYFCRPLQQGLYLVEPLSAWRHLAAAAAALRDTTMRLRQQMRPLQAHLTTLAATLFGAGNYGKQFHQLAGGEGAFNGSRSEAWSLVGARLNEWLSAAPVRFFAEIREASGRFDLDFTVGLGLGALPAIAAQLLAAVSDPQRGKAAICSFCQLPFLQTREPSRGTRRYCWPCRKAGKPGQHAVRDSRARQRKQRSSDEEDKHGAQTKRG